MTEYKYEFHRRTVGGECLAVSVSHWFADEGDMREEASRELAFRNDATLLPVYIARGGHFCEGE